MNEIRELEESKEILKNSGIYFNVNEDCIEKVQLLFIGNEGTPYENGYYLFELTYPDNYPMIPPKMKYYTQGSLIDIRNKITNVRFNPNLYTNGKVCLSMLNTWNGPGWVPTNTISNIVVAIQALVLNEMPLQNEPGFENSDLNILETYNDIIKYSNYKISILDQINLGIRDKFKNFKEIIEDLFLKNSDLLENNLRKLVNEKDNLILNSSPYNMNIICRYTDLYNYFKITIIKLKVKKNIH